MIFKRLRIDFKKPYFLYNRITVEIDILKSLRALVVTTKERLENLMRTTKSIDGANFFWFTTFNEASYVNILTKPICVIINKETKMSLL